MSEKNQMPQVGFELTTRRSQSTDDEQFVRNNAVLHKTKYILAQKKEKRKKKIILPSGKTLNTLPCKHFCTLGLEYSPWPLAFGHTQDLRYSFFCHTDLPPGK